MMVNEVNPVVVVPVHDVKEDAFSRISLNHLRHFLGRHRLVLAKPEQLDWSIPGLDDEYFPTECFGTLLRYNKFQLSPAFYERFAAYSHILIYHLDALVFSDDLLEWCKSEYDYIGATFYPDLIEKYHRFPWTFATIGVGNGGFSLRRVSAFLNHLDRRKPTSRYVVKHLMQGNLDEAKRLFRYRKHLTPSNYLGHELLNEDVYWGIFAPMMDPTFRVAPPEVANRFAFEHAPDLLFKANGGHMPFGCHAYYLTEDHLKFWAPHLLESDGLDDATGRMTQASQQL